MSAVHKSIWLTLVLSACASSHTRSQPGNESDAAIRAYDAGESPIDAGLQRYPTGWIVTIDVDANMVLYSANVPGEIRPFGTVQASNRSHACTRMVFDRQGRLVALCNRGTAFDSPSEVEVFAPGALAPVPPGRVLAGVHTQLDDNALDLAVDSAGFIYVVRDVVSQGQCGGSILVFAPDSDGDVAPLREIAGDATGLKCSAAIAIGADEQIYVGNANGGPVLVFDAKAAGNAAPSRRVGGAHSDILDVTGLALDASGRLYVSDWTNQDVLVYAPLAPEGAAAERTIQGISHPTAVAVGASGAPVLVNGSDDAGHHALGLFSKDAAGVAQPEAVLSDTWGGGVAISP
jgi:hypothetical protein